MNLYELSEARKNPEINKKQSPEPVILDRLETVDTVPNTRGTSNLFLSLTSLEKLGINPQSKYHTPLGIYSYPADYLKEVGKIADLPYASEKPYVNVFSVNSENIVDLRWMTEDAMYAYLNKMVSWLEKNVPRTIGNWDTDVVEFLDKSTSYATVNNKMGGRFWYVTMKLSHEVTSAKRSRQTEDMVDTNSLVWTKLFRVAGIDGFIDTGIGIIHPSEPTQAVFFTPSIITDVERYVNYYAGQGEYMANLIGHHKSKVFGTLNSLLAGKEVNEPLSVVADKAGSELKFKLADKLRALPIEQLLRLVKNDVKILPILGEKVPYAVQELVADIEPKYYLYWGTQLYGASFSAKAIATALSNYSPNEVYTILSNSHNSGFKSFALRIKYVEDMYIKGEDE